MKNDIASLQGRLDDMYRELELMPKNSVLGRLCIESIIKHYEAKLNALRREARQNTKPQCH